jgi:hypothetical protein
LANYAPTGGKAQGFVSEKGKSARKIYDYQRFIGSNRQADSFSGFAGEGGGEAAGWGVAR